MKFIRNGKSEIKQGKKMLLKSFNIGLVAFIAATILGIEFSVA